MNQVSIEIGGLPELMKTFRTVKEIMKYLAPTMLKIALQVEGDAKDFVTGRKGMDKYQIQAAEENNAIKIGTESLGVITDRLRSSIKGIINEITEEYIEVAVGTESDVVYARIHELGGIIENAFGKGIHVEMPARPYLMASLLKNKEWIQKELNDRIQEVLS
jgi:phage gpG-like protein